MPHTRYERKEPLTRSECLDELNHLLHEKRRHESEFADWIGRNPQGSAPGLVALIAEYDRKIGELQAIFDRANQSSRPRQQ